MSGGYCFPQGFTVETLGVLLRELTLDGKGNLPILSTANQTSIDPVCSLHFREPYDGFNKPWVELD